MIQNIFLHFVQSDGMRGSKERLLTAVLVSFASMLLSQCRMTRDVRAPQPTQTSSLAIKGDIFTPQAALKPFHDDDLEDVVWVSANAYPGAPSEIHGFDDREEVWCIPIKEDSQCIKKTIAWREQCVAQGGAIKRCQDCREICDKPLAHR
jgi:hypothetical protein